MMKAAIERTSRLLNLPLKTGPRGLLLFAAVVLVGTYFLPFWKVTTFGPEGLRLGSYSFELAGSEARADSTGEVAGEREVPTDFSEFRWLPFALGVLALLFLRAAVLGTTGMLVDVSVLFVYVAVFSVWSIETRFSRFGEASPASGAYALAVVAVTLGAALIMAWRQCREEVAGEVRMVG
jgi:hypothetical protein